MSSPYDGSRPSFSERFRSALTPRDPVHFDANTPNPVPTSVKVGGWLTLAGGMINTLVALYGIFQRQAIVNAIVTDARAVIADCVSRYGGIGTEVTSTETTPEVTNCKGLGPITPDRIDALSGQLTLVMSIILVLGLAGVIAGYFTARGQVWGRRLATTVAIVLVLGMLMQLLTGIAALLAALLTLIGMTMTYVGSGASYFIRAKAKGSK
jgi:uncharacterized membrane protein (UPF0136 family)